MEELWQGTVCGNYGPTGLHIYQLACFPTRYAGAESVAPVALQTFVLHLRFTHRVPFILLFAFPVSHIVPLGLVQERASSLQPFHVRAKRQPLLPSHPAEVIAS